MRKNGVVLADPAALSAAPVQGVRLVVPDVSLAQVAAELRNGQLRAGIRAWTVRMSLMGETWEPPRYLNLGECPVCGAIEGELCRDEDGGGRLDPVWKLPRPHAERVAATLRVDVIPAPGTDPAAAEMAQKVLDSIPPKVRLRIVQEAMSVALRDDLLASDEKIQRLVEDRMREWLEGESL